MSRTLFAAMFPALLLSAGAAGAQNATPAPRETDIPFATRNGIRTFTSDTRGDGVYLQDRRKNWYHATLAGPCPELPFATGIGFTTFGGSSALSRGDTILAGRDRCMITSLVRSGPPPEKPRKAKKG